MYIHTSKHDWGDVFVVFGLNASVCFAKVGVNCHYGKYLIQGKKLNGLQTVIFVIFLFSFLFVFTSVEKTFRQLRVLITSWTRVEWESQVDSCMVPKPAFCTCLMTFLFQKHVFYTYFLFQLPGKTWNWSHKDLHPHKWVH